MELLQYLFLHYIHLIIGYSISIFSAKGRQDSLMGLRTALSKKYMYEFVLNRWVKDQTKPCLILLLGRLKFLEN